MKKIKMSDIYAITVQQTGYGHWKITIHSHNDALDGLIAITTDSQSYDDYKDSDNGPRHRRGFLSLRNEVLRTNGINY
jgi:hypothetical protein